MPSIINDDNANDAMLQATYPEFYDLIHNHRSWMLYDEFHRSMTHDYTEAERLHRPTDTILAEYEKEKKKLMKLLQPFKNVCKQPGVVLHRLHWDAWRNRIRTQ
jgi:hypothetical protein